MTRTSVDLTKGDLTMAGRDAQYGAVRAAAGCQVGCHPSKAVAVVQLFLTDGGRTGNDPRPHRL